MILPPEKPPLLKLLVIHFSLDNKMFPHANIYAGALRIIHVPCRAKNSQQTLITQVAANYLPAFLHLDKTELTESTRASI